MQSVMAGSCHFKAALVSVLLRVALQLLQAPCSIKLAVATS
jgi:type III secretory pathway component EscR